MLRNIFGSAETGARPRGKPAPAPAAAIRLDKSTPLIHSAKTPLDDERPDPSRSKAGALSQSLVASAELAHEP